MSRSQQLVSLQNFLKTFLYGTNTAFLDAVTLYSQDVMIKGRNIAGFKS